MKKTEIALFGAIFLIAFFIGFSAGQSWVINSIIESASQIQIHSLNIGFNETLLADKLIEFTNQTLNKKVQMK